MDSEFRNALADSHLLHCKDFLADRLKVKSFHITKYKLLQNISSKVTHKGLCSNWEHVKLLQICKKFTEWNINEKNIEIQNI